MTIRELLATTSIPMAPAEEGGAAAAEEGGGEGSGEAGAEGGGGEPGSTAATGGSTETGSIVDNLSDSELAQQESLKKFKTVEDLAKSYTQLEKKLGQGGNDNQQGTVPEDPTEYELPGLADDAEFQPNEQFTEQFKQKAHELGLSNEQVKALYSWYVEGVGEPEIQQQREQAAKFREQAEQQLRKEFGNSYNERMHAAKQAVDTFGGDELKQVLDQTGLGDHPAVVKAFAEMGKQLSEDTIGGSAKGEFGRTPEEAANQIKELRQDSEFMNKYLDKTATGHDEAVEKMNALYRDAYPDQ